jgi:hypothetical protein
MAEDPAMPEGKHVMNKDEQLITVMVVLAAAAVLLAIGAMFIR